MKKLLTFVAVAACTVAIAGCKEKVATPTEAFQGWLHAIEVCDVEAVKAGLTDETVTQFTQMGEQMKKFVQPGADQNPEDLDIFKQMCKAFKKTAEVKEFTEEINGDEARVKFTTNGKENSAPMMRTEKGWKLDLARMMREAFEAQMAKMKIQTPPPAENPVPPPVEGAPVPAEQPTDQGAPAPAPADTPTPAPEPAPAAEAPAPAPAPAPEAPAPTAN